MYVEGGAGSAGAVVAAGTSFTALAGAGWLGTRAGAAVAIVLTGLSLVSLHRVQGGWLRLDSQDRQRVKAIAEERPTRFEQRPPPAWFLDMGATWGRSEAEDGSVDARGADQRIAYRGRPVGRPPS